MSWVEFKILPTLLKFIKIQSIQTSRARNFVSSTQNLYLSISYCISISYKCCKNKKKLIL